MYFLYGRAKPFSLMQDYLSETFETKLYEHKMANLYNHQRSIFLINFVFLNFYGRIFCLCPLI